MALFLGKLITFNGMVAPFEIYDEDLDDIIFTTGAFYSKKHNVIVTYNKKMQNKDVDSSAKYMEWLPTTNEFIFSDKPITRHECKYFIKKEITPSYERSICERCGKNWLEIVPEISQTSRKKCCDFAKIADKIYFSYDEKRVTAPDIRITF